MYTFEIGFRFTGEMTDDAVDAVSWLLGALYKNGQICGESRPYASTSEGMKAFVQTPASDSLDEQYANRYVRESIAELTSRFDAVVGKEMLGRDQDSAKECVCEGRTAYILYTNFLSTESPLRCADCFGPVPLYVAQRGIDHEYLDVISWMRDYKACDTLQMHTVVGERFAEGQMSRFNSALSMCGRENCTRLEATLGNPVYYYLYKARGRSINSEQVRRCPSCGQGWLLKTRLHSLFDFRCDTCRLLSNVAFDVRS